MNAREMCNLRQQFKVSPTLTRTEIKERRKTNMIHENTVKFGDQVVGIHGQELPLFSAQNDSKTWWEYLPKGSPKVQSHVLLKQNHKFYAKNDEMLINSVRADPAPEDPFKINRVININQTKEIPEKPNNVSHFSGEKLLTVPTVRVGHKQTVKWSQVEGTF